MGIKFDCDHCGRTLNVKDFLAGKRGICPKCGGRIEVPAPTAESDPVVAAAITPGSNSPQREVVSHRPVPTAVGVAGPVGVASAVAVASMVDPIAESPQAKWFVLPAGSTKNYGPALGDAMRQWIREGRVGADALVWREGWSEWRKAAAAFPQLAAAAAPLASTPSVSSAASLTVAVPAFARGPNGPVANQAPSFELPVELEFVPSTAPTISPTAAPGSAARSSVVRRRSNRARNVTLVVLVLAVVALAIPLVWVIANQ